MALELSELKFVVNDSDLKRASDTIGELVTNVGKLDKTARDAAQTEAVLAKAAKLNADANLQNAKAQDVRLKSTITADKADQQATASIEKKTKATEKVNEVVNKNVGVLQRQKDILEFQTQGFSKGQSSILAYGKAAGLAAEDIGELGKVLETQRKLMGGDPFDKSLSGLKSLQNQYTELKESVRQYATDSNLTAKQTRELARDKERLIEKMKVEGASFSEIRQAVRAHNTEYVNLATSYNKMTSAEDAVVKSRKEAVNATNYLTQADQKMAAALDTSNTALDKAGTDSLVKYETALRKSGVSQDVATLKLAKYKAQLEQVQIQEQKRREEHLTRALAPQATDIVVSLWSGQNPLTVLLQQGGQVTDLFMRSGVAAEKFGEVVKSSMKSMLPSILTVAKGIGGLLVDGFVAAGKAVSSFLANAVGMAGALDKMYMKMSENGPSKWGGAIQGLSSLISGVFASGVAVAVAVLISLGIAFKNAIKEGAELNRNLELTGASLALTKSSALELAQSLASSERPVANVVNVINELAKAGKFSSENIALVTNAAIDLERYGKVSIAETAKELSKLREDPVKALLEVAEKTGYVNLETVATIKSLREQGKMAGAAELAMKAWATSSTSAATSIKNQMSPLEQVWDGILSKINQVIGKLQDVARGSGTAEQIADKEAQLASIKGGFFTSTLGLSPWGAKRVDELKEEIYMLKLQLQAEADITKERAKRSGAAAQLRAEAEATKEYTTALEKQASKELTLSAFVKKAVEERTKVVASALGKNVEDVKLSAEAISKITSGAELQWQEMQKKTKSSPSENYFATLMREATNNTIAANTATQELTKSEQKLLEVRSDPRFEKLTATQKQDVISKYEAAIAAEKQTALTEKLAEAEEHRLKLLGKSEGIGKQYYSDMQKLEEFAKVAGWSRSEVEELTRAVFMATPAWKAYEKALEDVNSAARKFNEDNLASQAATLKENESLDYRLSLLGKTTEEQRALSIEYNRANKISEVRIKLAKQLRDIEADIEKAKKAGLPEEKYKNLIDAQVQARKDAAEQEKVINREVVVQYKEDFQKEFDAIKNGISDSIVTAMFEGGKSGSKKFRDLVVAQLRKPVTMVVNAVVNTILGNIVGSLMGGAAAGAAGGAAGGIAGSIGSSIAGSAIMSGIGMMGAEGLANIVGFLGGDALGVLGAGASGGFSSAIAAAIGQIPVWGWIAGGLFAVASMFDDDSGTIHTGGAASYSVATGQRSGNSANQFGTGFGWVERGDQTISAMETLSKSLVEIFDGIAKTFGKTAGYEVAVAFADDTSGDGAWGAFAVRLQGVEILNWEDFRQSKWAPKEFGDGEEGYKQYLAAIAKDTRQVILDMDLPGWADQVLNDIGDAPSLESLSKAIQELAQMKAVYDLMTSQMVNFAGITDEAFGKLIKEFGDIGTMTNQVAGYYQNYYSEFERFNKAQADVTKSFTDLGLTMPTSREEFRKLAESQDLNTEAGRKMYAQLMALATSFGVVIDATEQLANARTDIVYRMMEQEAQLLAAQGRTVEADKKRREILDKQRAAEYERLMKVNPELARLTAELWALEDAAVAAANAAALEREISDNRRDYTDRILQQEADLLAAQGRTAEADRKRRELLDRQRAREYERLMALNPELAKLAYELWLLEDATAAATRAAALEREISDNRRDYTDRILQQEAALLDAQGRTAEADRKRRELLDRQRGAEYERLMKINPELAKLAHELWLLEDATAAATRAAALEREISDNRRDYTDRILQQEAELLDAQGRTAEADKKRRELLDRQRARENERLMALNPELAKLAYELWLLEDATEAATRAANERKEISDDLYNALVKAVDAEKTLLDEQKARLEETVSTLKAVFDILKSSVEDLYGEVSSTAAMQASEGRGVIAQAIATGILPDSKLLDTSIQAVRDEISNSLYVSKADADKARLIFAAQLALLKDTTEEQLTDAEKQLKAVNAQISYLDNILKTAKEQLDAFLGNTEVLKSVDKALADLYAFLQNPSAAKPVPKPVGTEKPSTSTGTGGGAVFGPGGGGGGSSQSYSYYRPVGLGTSIGYQPVTDEATISRLDKLSSLYHSFDGTGDLVGLLNSIKAAGGTMYDLEALSGHFYNDWVKAGMSVGIPAFAEGGNYRGGVALVGEEGPELINFSNPGQVYTARQTASMLSGESSEVVAELKAVRSEIIMLRAEVRADVSHNAKTAKLLDRVIPEGDSVQVTIS